MQSIECDLFKFNQYLNRQLLVLSVSESDLQVLLKPTVHVKKKKKESQSLKLYGYERQTTPSQASCTRCKQKQRSFSRTGLNYEGGFRNKDSNMFFNDSEYLCGDAYQSNREKRKRKLHELFTLHPAVDASL